MSSSRDAAATAGLQKPAAATREGYVQLESYAGHGPQHGQDGLDTRGAAPPRATAAPPPSPALMAPSEAMVVVDFWCEAGHERWFAKDADFDRKFRDYFLGLHEAAARGECQGWLSTPHGALALLLLLDQFPRNAFRGTPRMYATDLLARTMAAAAIEAGHDCKVEAALQVFFYLPFGHSENLIDQERSVFFCRRLSEPNASHAQRHHDIVWRFGRFPHRNPILGRPMTPEEQRYLDEGGYKG